MTELLRVYDPHECDEDGIPRDLAAIKPAAIGYLKANEWRRGGAHPDHPGPARCQDCRHPMSDGTYRRGGQWSTPVGTEQWALAHLRRGDEPPLEIAGLPVDVHFSACDEACRHPGPFRWRTGENGTGWFDDLSTSETAGWPPGSAVRTLLQSVAPYELGRVEASWRRVDVRCLGWPHDLRPHKIAVLCSHCWGARLSTKITRREDGWPRCPLCGDDELYSLDLPASIGTIAGCYRCGPAGADRLRELTYG